MLQWAIKLYKCGAKTFGSYIEEIFATHQKFISAPSTVEPLLTDTPKWQTASL